MTRDDIIAMARDAGLHMYVNEVTEEPYALCLEKFAALVAAAEREACTQVCEETTASWTQHLYNDGCVDCAKAIRARGN